MTRPFALIALLALLPACTYRAPSLEIADVAVKARSDSGVVLTLGINAENRNEVELPLRELRYSITLDSGHTFHGIRSPEAFLRRLGTQRLEVPAAFPVSPENPPPSGTQRYEITGTLAYTTPGEFAQILFDSGVRRPTVSFRGEGTLDFGP